MILAIDPGTEQSAFVLLNTTPLRIVSAQIVPNDQMLRILKDPIGQCGADFAPCIEHLAIEMVASFGMAVGQEVFETVWWIGRFCEAWKNRWAHAGFTRIKRIEVKMHLCHTSRAKDANIRQALIDKLGVAGTKKNPGTTYGISKDLWSALAVGVTYLETKHGKD